MNLFVISPESADPREIETVRAMLDHGLQRYHLRKPTWNAQEMAAWANNFSEKQREHFILHGSETLARDLRFGGVHEKNDRLGATRLSDSVAPREFRAPSEARVSVEEKMSAAKQVPQNSSERRAFLRSRSCHSLDQVRAAFGVYDAVFISPVFPSISKAGYGHTRPWTDAELQDLLSARAPADLRTRVVALGGIQRSTTERCRELGFDGVAVLGAIWQTVDPLAAFTELRNACSAFAGRPMIAHA